LRVCGVFQTPRLRRERKHNVHVQPAPFWSGSYRPGKIIAKPEMILWNRSGLWGKKPSRTLCKDPRKCSVVVASAFPPPTCVLCHWIDDDPSIYVQKIHNVVH